MRLIIITAVPFAIPAVIQLMIFIYVTNLAKDPRKFVKFRVFVNIFRSKPIEGYFGVISVCLSMVCTFSICFICGIPFNPVSSTMPFLVLAVGKIFK